jgi:protein SCO1
MNTKIVLLLLGLAAAAAPGATNETAEAQPPCCRTVAAQPHCPDRSVYQLDSAWTTDAGRQVKLGALRGRPQVVAMFYASCQFACPLTVNDLRRIEVALPDTLRNRVGFTLISFDSDRDTPAALKSYRAGHGLSGGNWTLLRGEPEDVRELAALLGVIYRRDPNGTFAHSNLITVLNAEGEVVFQQPGLNVSPDNIVAALKALDRP